MQKIEQYIQWALRTWPFLIVAAVGCVHYLIYRTLPIDSDNLNKIVAATLQLVGGLIVLYTINENLGLFKEQNIFSMVVSWIKEFPLISRSRTINIQPLNAVIKTKSSAVRIKNKFNTVEEQLVEIERQIDECRQLIFSKEKEINKTINQVKRNLMNEISTNRIKIQDVSSLIDRTVIGGIKTQLLGVLLFIYGAVLGIV
jgi:hypothetical protein